MKKPGAILLVIFVTVLLTGTALLGYVSQHPSLIRKCEIPEEYVTVIYEKSVGLYSDRVPLVPVSVTIERISGERAYDTIRYFPVGTVEMSYGPTDGFNIEKALSELQ